jgi:hypothetical protein
MSMIANLLRVTPAQLEEFQNDPSKLEDRIYQEVEEEDSGFKDIDKSWDGILFLLTGQNFAHAAGPFVSVFLSGQLIAEAQDLGYGPAHYLLPEQVVEMNELLQNVDAEDLKKNFDPAKMTAAEVYPGIWEEGDEAFDYLMDGFATLKTMYAQAAKNGEAMVTFLN